MEFIKIKIKKYLLLVKSFKFFLDRHDYLMTESCLTTDSDLMSDVNQLKNDYSKSVTHFFFM
jgi:hypothetical protein